MKPKTLLDLYPSEPIPQAPKETNKEPIEISENMFISLAEILEILQITYPTFAGWVKAGRFAGVRMLERRKGDPYKIFRADFMKWLNENVTAK